MVVLAETEAGEWVLQERVFQYFPQEALQRNLV